MWAAVSDAQYLSHQEQEQAVVVCAGEGGLWAAVVSGAQCLSHQVQEEAVVVRAGAPALWVCSAETS